MAASKKFSGIRATGATVYLIVRRDADLFRLNDADGTFAANPADPYLSATEDAVIKGLYEASESRKVWSNGSYTLFFYEQAAGAPAPVADTLFDRQVIYINNDGVANTTSLLGETLAVTGLMAKNRALLDSIQQLINQVRLLTTATEKRLALKI